MKNGRGRRMDGIEDKPTNGKLAYDQLIVYTRDKEKHETTSEKF